MTENPLSVTFWLNVDYPARAAVVHLDTCVHASPRDKSPRAGVWRNFRTLRGAEEAGYRLIGKRPVNLCVVCRPDNA